MKIIANNYEPKEINLKRLKDLREDNNLLQKDIAEKLKITRQQYSLYETEKRTLPIDLLDKLAEYYETSTDYILGRTDYIHPYPPKKTFHKERSINSNNHLL